MDKVLVITGASSGIGLATASLFKTQGYRVVNLSRSNMPADLGQQLNVDLSDEGWADQQQAALQELLAEPDQICLIHNASLLLKDSVQNSAANLGRVLQINLVASQQLNELVLPKMKSGSSILYIGSTLSEKAVANTLSYSTSKHAVLGLMRASCQDLFNTGIHTAAICPGFTDTQMLRDHVGNDQNVLDSIGETSSAGRLIEPEEIADTIWFCSQNPVINGAVMHANLGQREH